MTWRKPTKLRLPFTFFSDSLTRVSRSCFCPGDIRTMPSERKRRRRVSREMPSSPLRPAFKLSSRDSSSLPTAAVGAKTESFLDQVAKISRKSVTSSGENISSAAKSATFSWSLRSLRLRNTRRSCTNSQKRMDELPSSLTASTPASRAAARAPSRRSLISRCSWRVRSSWPTAARRFWSSPTSMSPLLSASYLPKAFRKSCTSSSLKPACLRCSFSRMERASRERLRKSSKSRKLGIGEIFICFNTCFGTGPPKAS
mmetsp:Transcript_75925/g.154024  ORF Transcript_75925/g.154024 Transcript_75925/m.154024 type:complete len:257 (-) Transcript_75925:406-1176(-)